MTDPARLPWLDDYQGKSVVVTGCSSGIGLATAAALVGLGAEVHGFDRQPRPDLALASFNHVDLAEPRSVDTAVAALPGSVRALFNCAGLVPMAPPLEVIKVNILGLRCLTEGVVGRMSPGAAIVSVSSNGGFNWRQRLPLLTEFLACESFDQAVGWCEDRLAAIGNAYAFSKAAVTVWTMQQSALLITRGIRINATSPGSVQTPMLDAIEAAVGDAVDGPAQVIGRRSSPDEQVGALLLLNSDAASYINGVELPVDGGFWASLSLAGNLT